MILLKNGVIEKTLEPKEILKKSKYPSLLCPDSNGDLIGTEPKFYMEIEDTNDRGLGEVVSHIAEVYIKVKQHNTKTEQVQKSEFQEKFDLQRSKNFVLKNPKITS